MIDRFFLRKLYDIQDETVEHKEPRYDGNVSYFIEAAGDIYRECTKERLSIGYIDEKLSKLSNFKELTSGDLKDLREHHERHPTFNKDFEEYLKKRVYRLWSSTLAFDFKEHEARRIRMLQALKVIREISKWGMGQVTASVVEKEIIILQKMFGTEDSPPKDAFWL